MLAKTFGARLRKIREERFLSQRQLAEDVGIETVQILAGEEASNRTELPIHDISLLERFRDLEKLDRKDRQMIIDLIDAVIASRQIEQSHRAAAARHSVPNGIRTRVVAAAGYRFEWRLQRPLPSSRSTP